MACWLEAVAGVERGSAVLYTRRSPAPHHGSNKGSEPTSRSVGFLASPEFIPCGSQLKPGVRLLEESRR